MWSRSSTSAAGGSASQAVPSAVPIYGNAEDARDDQISRDANLAREIAQMEAQQMRVEAVPVSNYSRGGKYSSLPTADPLPPHPPRLPPSPQPVYYGTWRQREEVVVYHDDPNEALVVVTCFFLWFFFIIFLCIWLSYY
jgi:hypothetical protein